jgi:hypothetical protein
VQNEFKRAKIEFDMEDEEVIRFFLDGKIIDIPKTPYFYVVCDGQIYIKELDNVLISCGLLWENGKFKDVKLPKYRRLIVDSGGFQLLSTFKEYPFTYEQYYNFVERLNPDYFVSMDYPCDKKENAKENIEKTIDNLIKLKEFDDERLIPVIQGYDFNDYLYCLDRLKSQGLLSDYVGIGSLVPKSIESAERIILALINELKGKKIHIFGLKIELLKNPKIMENIYSFDTMSYLFRINYGKFMVFTGNRLVEIHTERKLTRQEVIRLNLKAYLEYCKYLWEKNILQPTLLKEAIIYSIQNIKRGENKCQNML